MGTAERRERERLQRQEAIIDAAEEVFFDKGYKNSTMEDVAAEAELSKGTLYLYFKSKEHLYLAISLRGIKILGQYFAEAVQSCKNGLDAVLAIGKAYVKYSHEHPDYFMAMTYTESLDPTAITELSEDPIITEVKQVQGSALTILIQKIEEGKADGTIRPELDATTTALLLWAQSNGVILMQKTKLENLESDHGLVGVDLIESFYDFVKRSIATQNH
jgi:TetR/AcrR family transcriptional regulator